MNLRPLRPDQQQKSQQRWNYQKNSEEFIGWVNKLGIERTYIGRLAHYIDRRFHVRSLSFLFLYCLLVSFIIGWEFDLTVTNYHEGELAKSDVQSPMSFDFIDSEMTARKQAEAEESVPPVFDYEEDLYENLASRVQAAFKLMRSMGAVTEIHQHDFEEALGNVKISKATFRWLITQKFNATVETHLVQGIERWTGQKIVDDTSMLKTVPQGRIIVNVLQRSSKGDEYFVDTRSLMDQSEVKNRLTERISQKIKGRQDVGFIRDFVASIIVPNLTLNKHETELRRSRAKDEVKPIIVNIKRGQLILRTGAPVQRINVAMLDEIKKLQSTRRQDFVALMTAIFFLVLLLCYWGILRHYMPRLVISKKDIGAMGAVLITILVICKFMLFVSHVALVDKFTNIPVSFYHFLLPMSAGAMMVGLLIPLGEVIWLFSIFLSVVGGFLLERDFMMTLMIFATCLVAARGVHGCKKREDLYWAGIKTGLVSTLLILLSTFMTGLSWADLKTVLLWNTAAGFIGGMLSSFITLTLIPLFENIFTYTTDVKLLELSNLNHPLLKELIVNAPGTYHHSLVVGSMCEAAAEAIGANPLLAKVCSYYHDIGKAAHAQYFIENQKPGENRHDHISPAMSKTILIAHVKDGVDMAMNHKLGKPIVDVIMQHHGTTLISFFYHKAKDAEDADMDSISENEYRYPGPKPQFREAALCMLADSIEAAARTLDEPTPSRLQSIVHNIVQKKFLDGQLDDCNLTLTGLSRIEEAFSRILMGIYHQRIDYPTSASGKTAPVNQNPTGPKLAK